MRQLQKLSNTHFWLMVFIVFLLLTIGWALLSRCSYTHVSKEYVSKEGYRRHYKDDEEDEDDEEEEEDDRSKRRYRRENDEIQPAEFKCYSSYKLDMNEPPISDNVKIVIEEIERIKKTNEELTNKELENMKYYMDKINNAKNENISEYFQKIMRDKIINIDIYGGVRNLRDKTLKEKYSEIPPLISKLIEQFFDSNMNFMNNMFMNVVGIINKKDITKEEAIKLLKENQRIVKMKGENNCFQLDSLIKYLKQFPFKNSSKTSSANK